MRIGYAYLVDFSARSRLDKFQDNQLRDVVFGKSVQKGDTFLGTGTDTQNLLRLSLRDFIKLLQTNQASKGAEM